MDIHAIGGQHFYYLDSCERQLWLYIKRIDLAEGFEVVELGKLIHEEMYEGELKEIRVGSMVIDFISKDGFVHETKSSKKIKKEHESQPLFYAYYLKEILGFDHIQGAKIHYPEISKVITLPLNETYQAQITQKIERILEISERKDVPALHKNLQLCRKCAFFDFCYV